MYCRWVQIGCRGLDSGKSFRRHDDGGDRHGLDDVSVLRGSHTKTGGRVGGACRGRDDVAGGVRRQ